MDLVEEIRNKLTIEEVISPYVQLKKAGRNYKALCPFHQEKSPSFIISPDKGLAYCFGCRKGGDIFACIQELENVDFPNAIKILAEKAHIDISQHKVHQGPKKENKDRILSLLQETQSFFQHQLKAQKKAQLYLTNRGYTEAEQQRFGLGYALDSFHILTQHLEQQGYTGKEMIDSGIASQKEIGDSNIYDRFRHRIMFPIHDPQGKLIAFGGRTLSSDENAAKYLNSPETAYYHKGRTLYCFHLAKQAIREQDQAIITEGYFDALTAHLHGYPQTVASLGTALTEDQLKLIGRFTKNLLFAFDADQSGQTAASRSIEVAQKLGFNVSIIKIPSGKDPDEAIRTAPKEWETAIKTAVKAMDYEFQKAFSKYDQSSIEGKKAIVEELLPIVNRLPNAIEKEHYLKKLSLDLQTSLKSLLKEFERQTRPLNSTPALTESPAKSKQLEGYTRGEYLIGLLMNFPQFTEHAQTIVKAEYLSTEQEKNLYKNYRDHYNQADKKKQDTLPGECPDKGRLQLLELYADEKSQHFSSPEEVEEEIVKLCQQIRLDYKKKRLRELSLQLAKAEEQAHPNAKTVISEYQQLITDQF